LIKNKINELGLKLDGDILIDNLSTTLYATDAAEIVVPMEDQDLYWFDVPGFTTEDYPGAVAEVNAIVAGQESSWTGRVVRSEGRINALSRMHNVVVQVENPYASVPPLVTGQFVEIRIYGQTIDQATVIPRAAMHENQTVWVVDSTDSRLHFRQVDVARSNHAGIIIRDGLADNERVVVSPLKAVSDGMKVRFVDNNGGESS
jgi:multidrug efflux pump subunit AcrA (membrane-fusion protein)